MYFDQLTHRCHACPSAATVVLLCFGTLAAIALLVAIVVGLGKARPEQLPMALRGVAGVARRFLQRSSSATVRLGLQEKFKIIISFYRATSADRTRDLH